MAIGAAAALCAAVSWAFASILWRKMGDEIAPDAMNFAKCLIGSAYLALLLSATGVHRVDARELVFLALSGALGIALGDNFYFIALIGIGPRLATLLETLGPVLTAVLSVIFLGERPSPAAWLGILIACAGVAVVVQDGRPAEKLEGRDWARGLRYGLLSALCGALGVVLAKKGIATTPALEAALARMAFGGAALVLWAWAKGRAGGYAAALREPRRLLRLCGIVFISTFGGFWLAIVALKHADAWLVAVLLSTAPLFILPMTAAAFGERIRRRAALGTAVAVAGIALMLLRG